MKSAKNAFYKKGAPKLIFFNEIFFRKIWTFFTIENWLWKSNFCTFWPLFDHFVKFQLYRYQKNILHEWSRVKNLSHVSYVAWNVFHINKFMIRGTLIFTTFKKKMFNEFCITSVKFQNPSTHLIMDLQPPSYYYSF